MPEQKAHSPSADARPAPVCAGSFTAGAEPPAAVFFAADRALCAGIDPRDPLRDGAEDIVFV